MVQAVCPRVPHAYIPGHHALLLMLLAMELLLVSKNRSTQAEEKLCYNLIHSWLDATHSTNYFTLKYL